MNKGLVFLWIIETVILGAVEFAIQIPLRRQNTKLTRILKGVLFPVKLILIIVMALLFIAINSSISYRHGEFLVALYIVFIGDAASSVVEYVICYLRGRNSSKAENSPYRLGRHAIIYACFCVCFFLYGFINSQIIRETKHVWTAEGITRSHTFAFVADLHVGSAGNGKICATTVRPYARRSIMADAILLQVFPEAPCIWGVHKATDSSLCLGRC